jgi:hypothetical protein
MDINTIIKDLNSRNKDMKKVLSDKNFLKYIYDNLPKEELSLNDIKGKMYVFVNNAIKDETIPSQIFEDCCCYIEEKKLNKSKRKCAILAVDVFVFSFLNELQKNGTLVYFEKSEAYVNGKDIPIPYYRKI